MKRAALLFVIVAQVACKRRQPEPVSTPPLALPDGAPAPISTKARELAPADALPPPVPTQRLELSAGDAPPVVGGVRFAVIGDYGAATPGEAAVARMVKAWRPEFVITLGDNNYPNGEAATIDVNIGQFYAEFIGNYRGRFGPGSATNRFWPSPGNHDWISGLDAYLAYFTLPGNERYYDVDLGIVHLFALDSDPHEPDGISASSRQAAWLKQNLGASKACYDIVYFHHPAYSTATHGSSLPLRWPFRAWGAEVVLAGHDHTYERLEIDGIPYFVNGLGGASTYEFPFAALRETRFRYNDEFGAMRVTATPADITYEFITIDGKKRDELTVPSNCPR